MSTGDPAVRTGCTYCLRVRLLDTFKPLGDPFTTAEEMHLPLNTKRDGLNALKSALFSVRNRTKRILLPYKAVDFAINNTYFNNKCEFSTQIHKKILLSGEFVPTCLGVDSRTFYCMNCFYPDPQSLLARFPRGYD